jgi:putative selenate reductase
MPDQFYPPTIEQVLSIALKQLREKREIFNIPEKLFYNPYKNKHLYTKKFGHLLHNPVGLAAGPHTQLAQNILAGWLAGARFIELKTVQTLDELVVSKPCIDMQDEGYNCEWSQELKIKESYDQYLNAWILIHIFHHELYGKSAKDGDIGTIFNMSVGYDLTGINKKNVQWFLKKMQNCSSEKKAKVEQLISIYPKIANITIPDCISNSVTLSTMHGCPPREIEHIGKYLMVEKKLHTTVKLNPTLLGAGSVRAILKKQLGYTTRVPDAAFASDLKYSEAIGIIDSLINTASTLDLDFGVKLTNTLQCINHKDVFPKWEQKMYMSGKSIHPIAVNLAARLQSHYNGSLNISFSGGADCFNISNLIMSGFSPVTVCSDLLKPGGYGRLAQYFENLEATFKNTASNSIEQLIQTNSKNKNTTNAALEYLKLYANGVLTNKSYGKSNFYEPNIKTDRKLNRFDCIHAPCVDSCPAKQDIPDYMWHASNNNLVSAFKSILRTNPFPSVMGMICDHLCQYKCTRVNYDEPLLIREIKRYVAESAPEFNIDPTKIKRKGIKVAVIGAGPSGLSCAWFLNLAGFDVEVFEEGEKPGGMVAGAIPGFRLTNQSILRDIERISQAGVQIHYNQKVNKGTFKRITKNNNYVYIATGAYHTRELDIPGINARGVVDPLKFLHDVKAGKKIHFGKNVAVIGGGNTAMDAARTAYRMVGKEGMVTIIYRRTVKEMPADRGEIAAVQKEGINILELMSPQKINVEGSKVAGLECMMMELKDIDSTGRPTPLEIEGTNFSLSFDTIIPAVGQELHIKFIDHELLATKTGYYQTKVKNVFIGGDALRGSSTAINAIGDGRNVALEIIKKAKVKPDSQFTVNHKNIDLEQLKILKAKREYAPKISQTGLEDRKSFNLVISTLKSDEAVKEAARCLQCDKYCSVCTAVCPNHANYTYETELRSYPSLDIQVANNKINVISNSDFIIKQKHQVLNLADWCNECGNCTTFCPTSGSPYKDKPKVYFNKKSFADNGDGYLVEKVGGQQQLTVKSNGNQGTFSETWDAYMYEDEICTAIFNKETLDLDHIDIFDNNIVDISLAKIPEMLTIFNATKDLV